MIEGWRGLLVHLIDDEVAKDGFQDADVSRVMADHDHLDEEQERRFDHLACTGREVDKDPGRALPEKLGTNLHASMSAIAALSCLPQTSRPTVSYCPQRFDSGLAVPSAQHKVILRANFEFMNCRAKFDITCSCEL